MLPIATIMTMMKCKRTACDVSGVINISTLDYTYHMGMGYNMGMGLPRSHWHGVGLAYITWACGSLASQP